MSQQQNQPRQYPEDIIAAIKLFFQKDNERIDLANAKRQVENDLKGLKDKLIDWMKENGETYFNTPTGSIELKTRQQKVGIKKDIILQGLKDCGQLKDVNKAEEVVAQIWNNRPKEEKIELKRI